MQIYGIEAGEEDPHSELIFKQQQKRKQRYIMKLWRALKRMARSVFRRAKDEVREAEEKAAEKIDEASEDVKK